METLTNLGLHRVLEIAKDHVGCGVLLLDLIQEGSLGLWQAIQGYREGDYGLLPGTTGFGSTWRKRSFCRRGPTVLGRSSVGRWRTTVP